MVSKATWLLTKNGSIKSIKKTEDTHVIISDHLLHVHADLKLICCDKPFNSHLDYDVHQANKHPVRNEDSGILLCPICKKPIGKHKETMIKHIRLDHHNAKAYVCDQCPQKFITEGKLRSHVKTMHPDGLNFTCDQCAKQYKNRSGLHTHMKNMHGKETLQCDKCEFTSISQKYLENHRIRMHGTENIVCEQCGKTFTNPLSLKEHMYETHAKAKEIQCTFEGCDLVFDKQTKMRNHYNRVHIGIAKLKKIKCGYCDKMFLQDHQRKEHEKKHLEILDFLCELCDYKTFAKGKLRQHMKRVHGNEEYFCDYPGCTKKYGIRENMYAHKKRVHKVHWTEKFN